MPVAGPSTKVPQKLAGEVSWFKGVKVYLLPGHFTHPTEGRCFSRSAYWSGEELNRWKLLWGLIYGDTLRGAGFFGGCACGNWACKGSATGGTGRRVGCLKSSTEERTRCKGKQTSTCWSFIIIWLIVRYRRLRVDLYKFATVCGKWYDWFHHLSLQWDVEERENIRWLIFWREFLGCFRDVMGMKALNQNEKNRFKRSRTCKRRAERVPCTPCKTNFGTPDSLKTHKLQWWWWKDMMETVRQAKWQDRKHRVQSVKNM